MFLIESHYQNLILAEENRNGTKVSPMFEIRCPDEDVARVGEGNGCYTEVLHVVIASQGNIFALRQILYDQNK